MQVTIIFHSLFKFSYIQLIEFGCIPLFQYHITKTLLLPLNPNFPLSITLMPKKTNPNFRKVVVGEMDLGKWDTTIEFILICYGILIT